MEIVAMFYGTMITVAYSMFFYHNTGSRKH